MGSRKSGANYYFVAGFLWLALVAFSLLWNLSGLEGSTADLVKSKARGFIGIIRTNLTWKFEHESPGSQFASTYKMDEIEVGELNFERMDPENFTGQMAGINRGSGKIIYNITSLKLMSYHNRPDQWEVAALKEFERGYTEELDLVEDGHGARIYRYMAPLYVEEECLGCHTDQGYRIGDIRGGISVAFDAATYIASRKTSIANYLVLHSGLVMIGFAVILAYRRSVSRADQVAQEALERYKELIELTDAVHWELDMRTLEFVYISPQIEQMLGYHVSEWKDFDFWASKLHPKDRQWAPQYCMNKTSALEDHVFAYRMIAADGRTVWIRDVVRVEVDNGKPSMLRGMFVDITELKETESKLKLSLAEKEVLLKEVHHRVKNNMAVISSLQSLQMRESMDPSARVALEESRNRIRAMSLVHEKLYQSENLASVRLDDYVRSLVRMVQSSFGVLAERVRIELEVCNDTLGVDSLIPIGLIINELVTNSIKYAYNASSSYGEIRINCTFNEDGGMTLMVEDNGPGFGREVNLESETTLGLRLVDILVKQIEGSITFDPGPGAKVSITVPPQDRDIFKA